MKKSFALLVALVFIGCGRDGADEAPPAPPAAPGMIDVAQEAQRVEVGMTEAQVVEILGEPRTRVSERAGERLTFWAFDADKQIQARVYVVLDEQGKVVNVETIPI